MPNDDDQSMSETSSSSDDSDFVPMDISEADMNLIIQLDTALQTNPASYDAHVQLIEVLRRCNMRERLRDARLNMQEKFPLSESLWLDWISDELDAAAGEEDVVRVIDLLERAHNDYLSVPLWIQHLELVRNFDPEVQSGSVSGNARMRNLFERALTAAGLHVTQGGKLWDLYMDFELEQEAQLPLEERQDAVQRVRALYRRRLAVPLAGAEDTMTAYEAWERTKRQENDLLKDDEKDTTNDLVPRGVARSYDVAQRAYALREPFETALATVGEVSSAELLSAYLAYIRVEEGGNDPARVQVLYERALAAFPVTHFLWLRYGTYVEITLKTPTLAEQVYSRAVRNCPWVGDLWARLLRALERSTATEDRLQSTYTSALNAALQGPEDVLLITLAWADALRRRHTGSVDTLERLRAVFSSAEDTLKSRFPDFYDPTLQLTSYWADCERRLGGEEGATQAARDVWERSVKESTAGRHLETWLAYADFECRIGAVDRARVVFSRAFGRKDLLYGNGVVAVCQAWLRFEREYGNADDYFTAWVKVAPILEENAVTATSLAYEEPQQEVQTLSKESIRAKRQQSDPTYKNKKRLTSHAPQQEQHAAPPAKKPKTTQVREEEQPPAVGAPTTEPSSEPARPAEHEEDTVAAKAAQRAARSAATAFVKHLPDDATEAVLRELFAGCGTPRHIKFGIDKSTGRHRGFAYVEFETPEELDAACKLNGTHLGGKTLFVAKSNPPVASGSEPRRGGGGRGGRGAGGRGRGAAVSTTTTTAVKRGNAPKMHLELGTEAVTNKGGKPKPGLGFVPRSAALQRPPGGHPKSEENSDGGAPKSNADFRKLLDKK